MQHICVGVNSHLGRFKTLACFSHKLWNGFVDTICFCLRKGAASTFNKVSPFMFLKKVWNVINDAGENLFLCFGELFHKSCFIVWAVLCWDFIGLKGVFKSQTNSSIEYPFSRPAWSEQDALHPVCGFHGLAFNMSQWCLFQWSQPCIRLAKHPHTPTSVSSHFTQPYTK